MYDDFNNVKRTVILTIKSKEIIKSQEEMMSEN